MFYSSLGNRLMKIVNEITQSIEKRSGKQNFEVIFISESWSTTINFLSDFILITSIFHIEHMDYI